MIRLSLASAGFDIHEAEDGFAALRRLEALRPDVILLDLLMPGLDGYNVLSELMASAYTCDIPVVVVTASPEPPVSANVHCVLRKPVMPEEILTTIERCMRTARHVGS
jgi:CheY-like chemotaxis protein